MPTMKTRQQTPGLPYLPSIKCLHNVVDVRRHKPERNRGPSVLHEDESSALTFPVKPPLAYPGRGS